MRLFIAVNFDEETKNSLMCFSDTAKHTSLGGKFSHRENLHITLVFLGEVAPAKLSDIKQVIDSLTFSPFPLRISGFGTFGRGTSAIGWAGIENSAPLQDIYHYLYRELTAKGFVLEDRTFKPHLTLARELLLPKDAEITLKASAPNLTYQVRKIDLMKSERIGGKLTYTAIYSKESERGTQ